MVQGLGWVVVALGIVAMTWGLLRQGRARPFLIGGALALALGSALAVLGQPAAPDDALAPSGVVTISTASLTGSAPVLPPPPPAASSR